MVAVDVDAISPYSVLIELRPIPIQAVNFFESVR
jgi:hypothetical protein